ncbi:FAD-dependent oxidoreductase [Schaalia canis]|uniref:Pyridine nucleotide-disulfide oxidoreductase n=1 Tax=Schaalia canis TaxID=100469 RepID=A0A3P1SFK4_9ACTO|nr:FAD-dependent oxidoreductase [Schaalia canis]RRC95769.1 pyridine nucleotide-disulfide oxidoreductase [Schaalia canis]
MRIVVVGGVGGGMSCAARMRRHMEDAEVIVLEKDPDVSVATCGLPYFVGGEIEEESALTVQTPAKLKAWLNLDVRTNHEAIRIDVERRAVLVKNERGEEWLEYDALVLSPGGEAVRLPIPGIDRPEVRTLRSIEDARFLKAAVNGGAKRAVVIGAGFIGVEAAENLAEAGLEVALVEGAPHILMPFDQEIVHPLRVEMRRLGVTLHEGVSVAAIHEAEHGVIVELTDGTQIPADIVVSSAGVRANTELAESAGIECENGAFNVDHHGRTNIPGIWAIGDAVNSVHAVTGSVRPVQLAGPANRGGRLAADDIAASFGATGNARPMPQPLATAIVRVGKLMAATTGANRSMLDSAGIDYRALHVMANNHVGYFPGAVQMFLVLYVDLNGELLGAQGVGEDGIDRRIDVIATAMRGGLTVEDLMDLDLCYAPPFGAAKDAVNLLGMVGENVAQGFLDLWYPWQLEDMQENALILDVRTPAEAEQVHIEGALVIPHTELRERMEEVREAAQGRFVAVHCRSGMRSYLSHRMLKAAGIPSASLSAGMLGLEAYLGDSAPEVLVYGD